MEQMWCCRTGFSLREGAKRTRSLGSGANVCKVAHMRGYSKLLIGLALGVIIGFTLAILALLIPGLIWGGHN